MAQRKASILKNYTHVVLDMSAKHFMFSSSEEEVQRMLENNELGDTDVVLALTPETIRVAERKNFIELL